MCLNYYYGLIYRIWTKTKEKSAGMSTFPSDLYSGSLRPAEWLTADP